MTVEQVAPPEWAIEERAKAIRLRAEFLRDFGVCEVRWTGYNLSRMLHRTGERPPRVAEIRAILGGLGMGDDRRWPGRGGVFDHGEMWALPGGRTMIIGHPYHVSDQARVLLAGLSRFSVLRVNVDDRPSYYGFGTHHVRIELAEVRQPFKPYPSTPKTRAAARAARKAFSEAFDESRGETV